MPNIKEEIAKLVRLQEIDTKIFSLTKEKAEQPKILEEIVMEFETKKAKLRSLEENKQKQQLKQKGHEGELAAKEESIKKTQGQLGALKTNKEYQAKLSEIESLKADKSLIEEEILKLMDDIDALKTAVDSEKKSLEVEEKTFNEKKAAALNKAIEVEAELNNLEGKRKIASEGIGKKTLASYEYILHGKNGLALVKVTNNSCLGCFMHVPHQVINQIKMHDQMIYCESCARILYLEEDVQT